MTIVPKLKVRIKDPEKPKDHKPSTLPNQMKSISSQLADLIQAKKDKSKLKYDHINKRNQRNIESKLLQIKMPIATAQMMKSNQEKLYFMAKEFIDNTKKLITYVMTRIQDPSSF